MKFFSAIICLLFTSICYSQEKTYQVGIYGDIKNTDPLLLEQVEKAWNLSGLNYSFVDLPAERSLRNSALGKIDADFYRFPHTVEGYPELIKVPVAITTNELWVYVHESKACFKLEEISEFIPVGVLGIHYFDQVYAQSNNGYHEIEQPEAALKLLESDRAQYTVANERVISSLSIFTGIKVKKCFNEPLISQNAYTYIHNQNSNILEILTKSYETVFKN